MSASEEQHFLNNLKIFIREQESWLKETLCSIGWSFSDLEKLAEREESDMVTCCINAEHRLPKASLDTHLDKCEKKNGQYPQILDTTNFLKNEMKNPVIMEDFNNDSSIIDQDQQSTSKKSDQSKPQSSEYLMELLAAERDAKRRRAAHRGKRVHSNKKSYNEILKELISNQMETLVEDVPERNHADIKDLDSSQKETIKSNLKCYLGVGGKYYSGNPHKRWMSIEKEEEDLIEETENKSKKDNARYRKDNDSNKRNKQDHSRNDWKTHRLHTYERSSSKSKWSDTSSSKKNKDKNTDHRERRTYFKSYFPEDHDFSTRKRKYSDIEESTYRKKSKKSRKKTPRKKRKSHHESKQDSDKEKRHSSKSRKKHEKSNKKNS